MHCKSGPGIPAPFVMDTWSFRNFTKSLFAGCLHQCSLEEFRLHQVPSPLSPSPTRPYIVLVFLLHSTMFLMTNFGQPPNPECMEFCGVVPGQSVIIIRNEFAGFLSNETCLRFHP